MLEADFGSILISDVEECVYLAIDLSDDEWLHFNFDMAKVSLCNDMENFLVHYKRKQTGTKGRAKNVGVDSNYDYLTVMQHVLSTLPKEYNKYNHMKIFLD